MTPENIKKLKNRFEYLISESKIYCYYSFNSENKLIYLELLPCAPSNSLPKEKCNIIYLNKLKELRSLMGFYIYIENNEVKELRTLEINEKNLK